MSNQIFNRRVGIEFEFSTQIKHLKIPLKKFFKDNDVKLKIKNSWGHSNGKIWELKTDSSTESELTTPAMLINDKNWKFMKKLLNFLENTLKVKITNRDGLHVHFDADDFSLDILTIGWLFCERGFTPIMKPSRVRQKHLFDDGEEVFSRRILYKNSNKIFATKFQDGTDEMFNHYSILNIDNFHKNKTVEIRCHEGTVSYSDVENWIKFCQYFFKWMKGINIIKILTSPISDGLTNEDIGHFFNLPSYLRLWYYIREEKFKRKLKK